MRPNSFLPSATVTRLLRQRMYGILLHEYEFLSGVQVKEWCGENIDSYQKPVLVKPVEPSGKIIYYIIVSYDTVNFANDLNNLY